MTPRSGFLAHLCPVDFSYYCYIIPIFRLMHSSMYGHGFPPSGLREVLMMMFIHSLGLFYQIIQVLHHAAAATVGTSRRSSRTDTSQIRPAAHIV